MNRACAAAAARSRAARPSTGNSARAGSEICWRSTKVKAKAAENPYDCIIPVSGGKDSRYQVYLMKVKYGMNPLLVTYNHLFNTKVGLRTK